MKTIVSWSGGKDSTYMLEEMLRRGEHIDEVVCCDTTIEFPEMLVHQQEFVKRHPELPITFLRPEHDFDYYMFEYVKKKGKYAGEKGMKWPNPNYIWCRGVLKLDPIEKYLKEKYGKGNYTTCIGIAYDEYGRYNPNAEKENKRYPLIEWEKTELEAIINCHKMGYTWGRLYERFYRVSCFCCPLQSIKELFMLYSFYPDLWQRMRDYDNRQTGRFRKDYTLAQLEEQFVAKRQLRDDLLSNVSGPAGD